MKKKIDMSKLTTTIPIMLWMFIFVAVPLLYIIFISFMQRGTNGGIFYNFTIENYTRMGNPLYFKVFVDSLIIALITTVVTLIIGYPFAYFSSKIPRKFNIIILIIIILPFWTNSLIRNYAWMILLRSQGVINHFLMITNIIKEPLNMLYTYGAVLIGMIYTLFPFMVLPIYNSIEKLDRSYIEAAKDLGASPLKAFLTITIPLTTSGIIAGCILVFVPSVGLFFIADLMGGSKVMLIGNLIRNQFLVSRDWPFGAALSIVMIAISIILIGIYTKIVGKKVDMEVF
ncbi:spermidine/putrescine transport system permease protein PotB [Clostridium pasteurianum DSM 525 = ATCC 6013]|uniref:ABC-type transporter, integral membrane subunit n=1 Tax=Clostridium pasteurianum DSM 525 = ATCC 6013 TaxID=1262449 RepID=A0A0H3J2V1_CLOPA|nr:ABC transporter permease subunit [Clostridium pasteurianum]AJA48251.1 spermidine/putrescine transport system permease protein PotB [Clostridium pasteurianum DSM 525 = ATCC 6013]AJA52239.1 spermidine/putrescine transport system permease protein PotB [Clostridium pasteurianum DSM 525 = ATCC 6013]AOZ75506.1 spermidine/putrescine ABC transporter permease [Clostridium pasteurianum DSM 525 = ATCC 6013]AOZ79301.1 spermidine/putrescine ABC transporter permease [Clostridium pasteurianum]ELP60599.1 s